MSETECNTGKLVPVKLINGESNEGFAFRYCQENGIVKDDYNKTYIDQLFDEDYRGWYLHEGTLYRCENDRDTDSGDIFQAIKNSDGTINYVLQYYNGGCSFGEAMSYAMKKLQK